MTAPLPSLTSRLDALRARLIGTLLTPGDDEYDSARRVHDFTVDRRPALIVRAAHRLDVVEALSFARDQGLPVAVRSGGHSAAGHGVADGALVIDLSQMRSVAIDVERKTARVQPGATSGDLAAPAHAYGLALSTGDTSTVGLGGLTLGGGIGWLARKHGLTIDSLLSAEVVTADGRVVRTSPTEHPDLFWAIRGGGGNFGVVTEFEFQLVPVGSVLGGVLVLPATRDVIRGYLDFAATAPDDLTSYISLMYAPPAPFIPAEHVGRPVVMVLACYAGSTEQGQAVIEPLRRLASPIADVIAPVPYPAMFEFTAAANEPVGAAVRSLYARNIDDPSIDAILAAMDEATSAVAQIQLRGLGGAIAQVPPGATAYAHRDAPYLLTVLGIWDDPADDGSAHRQWTEALWGVLKPSASGVFMSFLGDEGEGRVHEAYPEPTYSRLAAVKREYDPANVFRFNQNIRPV